jgi:hypothetical protein
VQTDGVGLAEIDYASDSYTRLNVNTTFTITKLTDSQGNRQVNGTLQTGETWNRTVALTQSESFQQQGGGATAAVAGTAFVVDCTSPTQCTFTAVIDNVTLTGANGHTQTLNPLSQCASTSGTLCTAVSQLTPDQVALIQWIRVNVFLDYVEHGLGNGIFEPFTATVVVNHGVVQSVTIAPNNPGPPPACQSTPANAPIVFDGSPGTGPPPATLGPCSMTAFGPDPQPLHTNVSSVAAPGGGFVTFSIPVSHQQVGNGWSTDPEGQWSSGSADVYFVEGTSVTLTMPANTLAFYFYAEPNTFDTFTITATAQGGPSSGAQVNGDTGVQFFGFYTTSSSNPIVSIAISTTDPLGMGIGEFGIGQAISAASASATATSTTNATTTPTTTMPTTTMPTTTTTPTTTTPTTTTPTTATPTTAPTT